MVHIKTFHLFSGAGGGILADLLLGHEPIGAVEIEKYPREVILSRQRDGALPLFPIWDDVKTFRSDNPQTAQFINMLKEEKGLCISGGFPCQDISAAGKCEGIKDGNRSGLWFEMSRIIGEIRPKYVFIENSPMLTIRGGTRVIADLTSMGYDTRWGVIGADTIGAPHHRARMWMVANTKGGGSQKILIKHKLSPNKRLRSTKQVGKNRPSTFYEWKTREVSSFFDRMDDGLACWVDRVKAIGNGQVPHVAKLAWETLSSMRS